MPPGVPRRWRLLGVSRASAGTCYAPYPRATASLVLSRTCAQHASQDKSKSTFLSTRNSAIIIPGSVAGAQPDDLIKYIEPVDSRYFSQDRFAIFFLTPAFATWLLDDRTFLQKALHQVYRRLIETEYAPHTRIHAVVAVVDRLPTPQAIDNVGMIEEEALCRMRSPPVTDTGHEGIAYITLRTSDFQHTPRTSQDESASIRFLGAGDSAVEGSYRDSLRLPLANTVFQTGLLNTMRYSTWEMKKRVKRLEIKSQIDLSEVSLRLHPSRHVEQRSALAVPLVPVTIPRLVEAGMGNILRRVVGPDQKSVTASEELEKVVHEYFKSRKEPPKAISVWALLVPKNALEAVVRGTEHLLTHVQAKDGVVDSNTSHLTWHGLWKSDPPEWNDLVTMALSKGARLHRVLSGGGGWGKKAGLLSLDPSSVIADHSSSLVQDYSTVPETLSSALQQVVRPGDSIQFLVSPPVHDPDVNDLEANIKGLKQLSGMRTPWTWEFGTIPSTTDALQSSSWQHKSPKQRGVFVFRNTFGALAEGGMTIQRQFKLNARDASAVVGATKVDVPFSRFSSVNLTDQPVEESDMGDDSEFQFLDAVQIRSDPNLCEKIYEGMAPSLLSLPRLAPKSRALPYEVWKESQIPGAKGHPTFSGQQPSPLSSTEPQPVKIRKYPVDSRLIPLEVDDEPIAPIHKYKVSTESLGTEREGPPPLIRKLTIQTPESKAYEVQVARIEKRIYRQRVRFATLMRAVDLRMGPRYASTPLKDLEGQLLHSSTYRSQHFHKDARDILIAARRRKIKYFENAVQRSETRLDSLHNDLRDLLVDMTHNTFDILEIVASSVAVNIQNSRIAVANILRTVSLRAQIAMETNNSAINVYLLNIALRRGLSDMLEDKPEWTEQRQMLVKKLKQLRAFNENLFIFYKASHHRYFQNRLQALEDEQSGIPTSDFLSATAENDSARAQSLSDLQERSRRLRIQQTLQIRSSRGPLWNSRKLRRAFDKLDIRYRRHRKQPSYRAIIDKLSMSYHISRNKKAAKKRRRKARKAERTLDMDDTMVRIRKYKKMREREEKGSDGVVGGVGSGEKRVKKRELIETVSGWLGG